MKRSFAIRIDGGGAAKKRASSNSFVIGIDEVGRGALAGPVVLAALRAPEVFSWVHPRLGPIRDSKQLTPRMRERWFEYLRKHPDLHWRVTRVGHVVIDRINIAKAANRGAYRLARRLLPVSGDAAVLLDGGLSLPPVIPHQTIVKGDESEPVIAAASIIAKVWRDRFMVRLGKKFPVYEFQRHKGYGTLYHRTSIAHHGLSNVHRKTFAIKSIGV